jgi:biopolymer transport protein ExbD
MGLRLPRLAYIAVGIILSGIVLPQAYLHWLETRTFDPLDMPVSLSRGDIKTPEFSVNLKGWYQIVIWVDGDFSGCWSGLSYQALRSRSTAYSNGRVIESSEGIDRYLGHFYVPEKGRYSVNLEITSDPACLNAGHPRIGVWTDSSRYVHLYNEFRDTGLVFVFAGLGLLAFSATKIEHHVAAATEALPVSHRAWHAYSAFHPRLALRKRFAVLPSFGLSYTAVLTCLFASLIFIYAAGRRTSLGIPVSVTDVPPSSPGAASSNVPPLVGLEYAGREAPPRLYLNLKPIRWEQLGDALTNELKVRRDRVVYVEADELVPWSDVIGAMDIVRSRHARVVLLTRKITKTDTR